MNKVEYLDYLGRLLNFASKEDRDDIMYDYEEHFRIGLEKGKTEEEIAQSLGDPRTIARQFKADCTIKQAEETASISNIFKAVLATIGLGFFNLVFVFGPFMALVGVLIALFSVAFALTVAGIAVFIATILSPVFPAVIDVSLNPVMLIFGSIFLTAFGLLFLIADCYIAKYFYKGTIKYLKLNLNIIKK